MFTREHLDVLQLRLELARTSLLAKRFDSRAAWALLSDITAHQKEAQGTPYEETLAVLADLAHSIWRVTRSRDAAIRAVTPDEDP